LQRPPNHTWRRYNIIVWCQLLAPQLGRWRHGHLCEDDIILVSPTSMNCITRRWITPTDSGYYTQRRLAALTNQQNNIIYNFQIDRKGIYIRKGACNDYNDSINESRFLLAHMLMKLHRKSAYTLWDISLFGLVFRWDERLKRHNFGLRPELRLTSHCSAHHCSLHNVVADVVAVISVFLCLFVNYSDKVT